MGVRDAIGGWLIKSGHNISTTDAKASRIWSRVLGGGGESDAGETVTVDVALQLATAWACVRLISETVATLPFMLYRDERDGSRTVAKDDPLYGILHDQPNADQTAVEFWEGVVFCILTWGNAYAEKVFIGSRLVALLPLRADWMRVGRDESGARVYRYGDPKGRRELTEDEVMHVRGFGNGGDVGLSPILYGRQTLGAARAADKAAAKMFANGVRPSGVLEMSQILKPDQRKDIRENVIAPFAGAMNAGGVFLAEGGMKFSPVTFTPEDAQMLETRAFHVEEICRWFNVPPILIGHSSSGQTMWGSGVEQIMLGWLVLGLRSILKRIESAAKRSLITPDRRAGLHPEFNIEGLLRADSKTRAELISTYVQNGIWSRNEVRQRENMPPYAGGEIYTAQTNLSPVDRLGTQVAVKTAPDDDA
ncbi:phage portal protein [Aureimonas sp. AU12]|uniref:phage portal protein n=1 Tax=Aureimonas sp. AU12 TaxID=1638161 RepID=UPI00078026E0|nr:phage portal protein [Aureimonas sp. AU12]